MIVPHKAELFPAAGMNKELIHGRVVHPGAKDLVDEECAIPAHLYCTIQEQHKVAMVLVSHALVDPAAYVMIAVSKDTCEN